jgi:ATP-dependent helicase YprA (DUF1998 family)
MVMIQAAETGSGKTGAFGIPVLQLVSEMRRATSSGVVRSTIAAPVASSSGVLPGCGAISRGMAMKNVLFFVQQN